MKAPEDWLIKDGKLTRTYQFANFILTIDFINALAQIAETQNHHPDLTLFAYKNLKIEIYTHDKDSITTKDYELAKAIEKLYHDN